MRANSDTVSTPLIRNYPLEKIRNEFPILKEIIHGKPLVYLDNAATTQKPQAVIDALAQYYSKKNSNIHRGVHYLSQEATSAYENARVKIQKFINASSEKEIIYTRGTTEGINLVAHSFVKPLLKEGDEIIISTMEHHSNIVPWQMICEEKKAVLKVIPITDEGELIFEEYINLLNEKTKFVSIIHVSNSLGTINPVKQIIDEAHKYNIPVLIDGAQSIQHIPIDVKELNCDFFTFSGHKIYGPTGIGVLYGKEKHLDNMIPYQGGGDMIASVTFEKTTYNDLPYKFEAGTPNIAGSIGLGYAIDYVKNIGVEAIATHEKELLQYATEGLSSIKGLRIIGNAKNKCSLVSFVTDEVHPHDFGTILDFEGIAIRTGHHCTQPLMKRFQVPATSRASFAMYNTKDEVDVLVKGIYKVFEVFA